MPEYNESGIAMSEDQSEDLLDDAMLALINEQMKKDKKLRVKKIPIALFCHGVVTEYKEIQHLEIGRIILKDIKANYSFDLEDWYNKKFNTTLPDKHPNKIGFYIFKDVSTIRKPKIYLIVFINKISCFYQGMAHSIFVDFTDIKKSFVRKNAKAIVDVCNNLGIKRDSYRGMRKIFKYDVGPNVIVGSVREKPNIATSTIVPGRFPFADEDES